MDRFVRPARERPNERRTHARIARAPRPRRQKASDALDRRATGYRVLGLMLEAHASGSLASPLSSSDREAAARAITTGLQEAEPFLRIAAIRAVQRGRVEGALPMLRVLAVTEPRDGRNGIGQAAADAVASLSR